MNIFVFCDMEGISGICRNSQVTPGGANYSEGRKYMTWEINACVQGCVDGGAKKIVVCDGHWSGFNVIWEELDERAEYILGSTSGDRLEKIEEFDGLVLLGYHSMAGTFQGMLEHTFSHEVWQNCWLNGKKAGEFAIDAALSGEKGVPVIMTSGDDKLCAEAEEFAKGVVAVQVKAGLHAEGGRLLPMKKAHEKIREGAAKAVKNCRSVKPCKVKSPVTMRVELVERHTHPFQRPGMRFIDSRTCEVNGRTVAEALGKFIG